MTKERMGEIALSILRLRLRKEGFRLRPNLRREIASDAAAMGIPVEEVMKFMELMVLELSLETFKKFDSPVDTSTN